MKGYQGSAVLVGVWLALSAQAWAQRYDSLSGGNSRYQNPYGMFGSQTFGQGLNLPQSSLTGSTDTVNTANALGVVAGSLASPMAIGGGSTVGGSTLGGSSFGGSALGGSSLSGSSLGSSSTRGTASPTSSQGTGRVNMAGQLMGSGLSDGGFVGADSQDVVNFMSMMGQGGAGATGSLGSSAYGTSGLGNRTITGTARNRSALGSRGQVGAYGTRGIQEVRTHVQLGFPRPGPGTPADLSQTLTRRLANSARIAKFSPIEVVLVQGTAVLRGAVATDHDRALAERAVLLEPGVQAVRNELVVGQVPGASAGPRPAAGP